MMTMTMILFLLLSIYIVIINCDDAAGISRWVKVEGKDYDRICVDLHVCTVDGYTRTEVFDLIGDIIYSSEFDKGDVSQLICRKLIDRNRKVLFILGDSYMRHLFQAMVLLISGNVQDGSLIRNRECLKKCHGPNQFYKHGCSTECIDFRHLLCGGLVQIHLVQNLPPSINYCTPHSAIIWSEGNHQQPNEEGYETKNATHLIQKFNSLNYGICPYLKNAEESNCNIFWVSSHQTLNKITPEFNKGMRKYFIDFENCGSNTKYIDVWDFTNKLVTDLFEQAAASTPDGIHWGLTVNLIKAVQVIIDLLKED